VQDGTYALEAYARSEPDGAAPSDNYVEIELFFPDGGVRSPGSGGIKAKDTWTALPLVVVTGGATELAVTLHSRGTASECAVFDDVVLSFTK
jgi:hypothetical protein